MTDIEIGTLIRDARKKAGMTQLELATELGVTWEMVSRYERGRSSALLKILDIAQILGVPTSAFFTDSKQGNVARQPSTSYITEAFIPVLSYVPSEVADIAKQVQNVEDGVRVPNFPNTRVQFAVRLGEGSNVRISTGVLLPKGLILCRLVNEDLQAGDTVIVARSGLISVESFPVSSGTVLAKVVEWVVKL